VKIQATRGSNMSDSRRWIGTFLDFGAYVQLSHNQVLLAYGEPKLSDCPDKEAASFYTPGFFLTEAKPWRVFPQYTIMSGDEVSRMLEVGKRSSFLWHGPDEAAFRIAVDWALAMIEAGKIEKAVPTAPMVFEGVFQGRQLGQMVARSLGRMDGGVAYGLWGGGSGIIGITPEILFVREAGVFNIDAVAGTGFDPGVLETSGKNQREHAIVVRDIVRRCHRFFGDGCVKLGQTRAEAIGDLWHLKTRVEVMAELESGFPFLVEALHPTPAVGISPRGDWKRICRELDIGNRCQHGAPFGFVLRSESIEGCLVAIRCAQWSRGEGAEIRAGCGITEESNPSDEVRELLAKVSATREGLGI
jgi:menaquinone-specific isochorismate synthase